MAQINFEELLQKTMGLDAASVGSATIVSAVRNRMAALGIKRVDDYWDILSASNDELQELIETVVVPETWFFRDPDAFSVLARLISDEWLPNHPTDTLRLMSVPCCTGEEPYSMVMALLDAGLSRDRFRVDAVDISVRALVRARRGTYGSNSFRSENIAFRDRYFEAASKGYSLAGQLRGTVSFHHGNLLASDFRLGSAPYDVIFCRNVLIYFDRETQDRVMKILGRLLTSSGYLFVGSAEAFLAASSGFKSVNQSMCFAFRKNRVGPPEPLPGPAPRPAATSRPHRRPEKQSAKVHTSPVNSAVTSPAPIVSAAMDMARARQLGDAGKFVEAGELCEVHLKQHGPSSEAFHLLGLVRDATGDPRRAAESYRKALYLEPNHDGALLHLGLLLEKQGDLAGAQRLLDRAQRNGKGSRT